MHILAIRPEPGLSSTVAAGSARGLSVTGYPLSATAPRGWTLPETDGMDGLLVGSANAFRHGGTNLRALTHLPVLAVGRATAEAAREAGFRVEATGTGGLQSLLDRLDMRNRHLLRLAGEDHVAINLPAGIKLTTRVVYHVQNNDISKEMIGILAQGAVVMLHSAGSAAHFAFECTRLGIDRRRISLAAIGPRVLEPVGAGWREVRAASTPSDAELLALAADMCQ